MDFNVATLGPCRKRVAVKIPAERVKEELDRQYDEINDTVALPGFRKGHAPRKILEKRFAEHLGKEVKEKLFQSAMEQLVEEKKVEPLEAPEVDLESLVLEPDHGLEFEFDLTTRPEFETPDYEGTKITVEPVEVTDEEIGHAVDQMRRGEARLETIDAGVEDDDILVIDWEARDGDSVEAHDENAYYPYGRGVVAGFVAKDLDEQLAGKKAGASATSTVRVAADDPREELRDRELTLEVTLKEVKRYVLPEIDEAFLKRHDFDDVEEMRDDVKKQLTRLKSRERDREMQQRLVDGLLDAVDIQLPEAFVEREIAAWARRKRVQLEMEGVDEDAITKRIDEERADVKANVERDMRRYFLLERIGEAEDVRVTETEILQAIQEIARAYGRPEAEVLASFRDGNRITELATQIRHRKIRELIGRKAEVEEVAGAEKPAAGGKKPAKKKATTASKKKSTTTKKAKTKSKKKAPKKSKDD